MDIPEIKEPDWHYDTDSLLTHNNLRWHSESFYIKCKKTKTNHTSLSNLVRCHCFCIGSCEILSEVSGMKLPN